MSETFVAACVRRAQDAVDIALLLRVFSASASATSSAPDCPMVLHSTLMLRSALPFTSACSAEIFTRAPRQRPAASRDMASGGGWRGNRRRLLDTRLCGPGTQK